MEKMPKDSRDKQAYSGDSSIHGLFGFQHCPNGYGMVLEKMNVETGIHLDAHILRSTKRRRADATCHASEQLKKGRKIRKLVKAGFADRIHAKEGVVYQSGGFNN